MNSHRHAPIHEIPQSYGNPIIARGTFGQVSIAVQHCSTFLTSSSSVSITDQNDSRCDTAQDPQESNETPNPTVNLCSPSCDDDQSRLVVIKKINNAIQNPCRADNLGSDMWSGCFDAGGLNANATLNVQASDSHEKKTSSHQLTQAVVGELAALRILSKHPNITPLLSAYIGDGTANEIFPNDLSKSSSLSLVFPFCPLDLSIIIELHKPTAHHMNHEDRRKAIRSRISIAVIRTIMKDILAGLAHCHSNGIIHGDIKPANLLMTFQGRIQLADFGLAQSYPQSSLQYRELSHQSFSSNGQIAGLPIQPRHHGICTIFYRPPELLYGCTKWTPSIDIWSCGCVFVELLTLYPFFPGKNVLNQLDLIFDVFGTIDEVNDWPTVAADLPDYSKVQFAPRMAQSSLSGVVIQAGQCQLLNDMITSMCSLNPSNRPKAWDLSNHDWFYGKPVAKPIADHFLNLMTDAVGSLRKEDKTDSSAGDYLDRMKYEGIKQATISRQLRSRCGM